MAALNFILFSLTIASLAAAQGPNPAVRVANGVLQGTWQVSSKGRTFASFQGVPYARPPIGKYRFKEPQKLKPWTGVWDATKPLSGCLQYDPFVGKITGSENCLFVNVYSANLSPTANLPVVVYIHGGAFMFGEGNLYGPAHLMNKDMVVVVMNYRLGPLGFLSTGDEVIPGNFGMKDQSFALRWVKENIQMFGGNPDSITLTGCSAGGASVHYHYLSPLSKGIFNRGIAFSGSAFSSWTHAVKPAQKARTLGAIVGCPTATSKELLDCLKYRPAEVIVNAQIEMMDWKVHMFTPFTPTIEVSKVKDPFLTQYPFIASNAGEMHSLPLITSVTTEEGLYPAAAYQLDAKLLPELEANWERLASNIFEYNDTLPQHLRPAVAAKIKQQYLGGKPVSQETFPQLVQALGDRLFVADVGKLAQIHAAKSGQPVYVYRYSYRGSKSLSNIMANNDANYGVSHADDVMSMFNSARFDITTADDAAIIEKLVEMVYSFAATGVPKVSNDSPQWQVVKPGVKELPYLEIASPTNIEMKSNADFGHKTFWDSLGFLENENYHTNVRDEL